MNEGLAVLIPAAGASRRFGEAAKQLLPWQGSTLLEHAIRKARSLKPLHCAVITGAYRQPVEAVCEHAGGTPFFAPKWAEGIGRSIAQGTEQLLATALDITRILIMLPDQPLVTREHLETVCLRGAGPGRLVATLYPDGRAGVPAVISGPWFKHLLALTGEQGARGVLHGHPDTLLVPCNAAELVEVDTPEDYQALVAGA